MYIRLHSHLPIHSYNYKFLPAADPEVVELRAAYTYACIYIYIYTCI